MQSKPENAVETKAIVNIEPNLNKKNRLGRRNKEIIFLISILIIPLAKVAVFYIGVNIKSLLFAFQTYEEGKYILTGFNNFKAVFEAFSGDGVLLGTLTNSLVLYFVGLVVGLPLSLLFSYYIYKGAFGSTIFKVMLFLPSIISNLVLVLMFQYLVEDGISKLIGYNLLTNPDTVFPVLVFFNVYIGFGSGIILYSNAMSKIDPGIIEYGQTAGVNYWQEFSKVVAPLVFPTITSFLVTGVSGIFTANMNLYSFFGDSAEYYTQTLGYYLFVKVIGDNATPADYPFASALGVVFTFVCVPLTLIVRKLLEKYGPSEN